MIVSRLRRRGRQHPDWTDLQLGRGNIRPDAGPDRHPTAKLAAPSDRKKKLSRAETQRRGEEETRIGDIKQYAFFLCVSAQASSYRASARAFSCRVATGFNIIW